MALFGLKKRDRVLDLTEKYKKQLDEATEKESNLQTSSQQTDSGTSGFNFFGNIASAAKTPEIAPVTDVEINETEERKKRLAKRLVDMTGKIEDLSNQIYHLQQRIEVLERKSGIRIE